MFRRTQGSFIAHDSALITRAGLARKRRNNLVYLGVIVVESLSNFDARLARSSLFADGYGVFEALEICGVKTSLFWKVHDELPRPSSVQLLSKTALINLSLANYPREDALSSEGYFSRFCVCDAFWLVCLHHQGERTVVTS